ncbi:MAG: GNAT family N-acetyltransferase [Candidatus Latescibacteria bacterium]|nr:GNAT family N-acetyltransferase [Candidatus Latescibacterota bacterium]
MESTEELIGRCTGPDNSPQVKKRAFDQLVRRFQDMVFGWAYARLGHVSLAQDVAQETFLVAYGELAKLRQPAAFPGWLRRIALRQCNRFIRAKKLPQLSLEAASSTPDPQADPLRTSENNQLREHVQGAIAALPEHERQAVTLFYISGYSAREVAAFLGTSETALTNRLRRARGRLKERLIDMVQDHLQAERPSRDQAFAQTIRQAVEGDWSAIGEMATQSAPFDFFKEEWVDNRRSFDAGARIRHHYVLDDPEGGPVLGYGAIEQDEPGGDRYRLFLVCSSAVLQRDVGTALWDQLMSDLRREGARSVWLREGVRHFPAQAPERDLLDFFASHGFAQRRGVWDLYLSLEEADWDPLQAGCRALADRGITISSLAEEMQADPTALEKHAELINSWLPDVFQDQSYPPARVADIEAALERSTIAPAGQSCFVAKHEGIQVGCFSFRRDMADSPHLRLGMAGVRPDYRRQGVAAVLAVQGLEWARSQGFESIRAFGDHRDSAGLGWADKMGLRRRLGMVVMEKLLE